MRFLMLCTLILSAVGGCVVEDSRVPSALEAEVEPEKAEKPKTFVEVVSNCKLKVRPTESVVVTINSNAPQAIFGVFTSQYRYKELCKPPAPCFRNDLPPHFLVSGGEENFFNLDLRAPVPDEWMILEPRLGCLDEIGRAELMITAMPFQRGRVREFYLIVVLDTNGDGKADIATRAESVLVTTDKSN